MHFGLVKSIIHIIRPRDSPQITRMRQISADFWVDIGYWREPTPTPPIPNILTGRKARRTLHRLRSPRRSPGRCGFFHQLGAPELAHVKVVVEALLRQQAIVGSAFDNLALV